MIGSKIRVLGPALAGYAIGQLATLLAQLGRVPLTVSRAGVDGYGTVVVMGVVTAVFFVVAMGVADVARIELSNCSAATACFLPNTRIATYTLAQVSGAITILLLAGAITTGLVADEWKRTLTWAASYIVLTWLGWVTIFLAPGLALVEVRGSGFGVANLMRGLSPLAGLACCAGVFLISDSAELSALAWGLGMSLPFAVPGLKLQRMQVTSSVAAAEPTRHWPLVWNPLVAFSATALDVVWIQLWSTSRAVAEYALANRLAVATLFLPLALRSYLWINLNRRSSEHKRYAASPREVVKVIGAFCLLSVPGGIALLLIGPELAPVITQGEFSVSLLLFLLFALSGLSAAGLVAAQALGAVSSAFRTTAFRYTALAAAVNVLLSSSLAWWLGSIGPALAGAVCNAVLLVALGARFIGRPAERLREG